MTGLTRTAFLTRFTDAQEIGRQSTAARLEIYYDNGEDVGRWIEHRPSTRGHGELIERDQADAARHWCRRLRQQAYDATAGCSR
jgi:hypothetical protein